MPEPAPTPLELVEAAAGAAGAAPDDATLVRARALLAAPGEVPQLLWEALAAALAWAIRLEEDT